MSKSIRVSLPSELFPVQAFFNAISDTHFVETMLSLHAGIGRGINDVVCSFPDDLDPGEDPFDGVRFSFFEETVVISRNMLRTVMKQACEAFIRDHPDQASVVAYMLKS